MTRNELKTLVMTILVSPILNDRTIKTQIGDDAMVALLQSYSLAADKIIKFCELKSMADAPTNEMD